MVLLPSLPKLGYHDQSANSLLMNEIRGKLDRSSPPLP